MSSIERRSIEELVARYEFEPKLQDIFVEGEFDCALLRSSLSSSSSDIRIYSIDTVDVPRELLERYSLTSGNKQRVLTLAKELEHQLDGKFSYICLTDRDLDYWFGKLENIRNHIWTKYTSMEMHFFTPDFIQNLLCVVCRIKISSYDLMYKTFVEILKNSFAFRCAINELSLNINIMPIEKSVLIKNGNIENDFDTFISNVLINNSKSDRLSEVKEKFDQWCEKLDGDKRQFIRGHDFTSLMAFIVKKFNGEKKMSDETVISRILINSALNNSIIRGEIIEHFAHRGGNHLPESN